MKLLVADFRKMGIKVKINLECMDPKDVCLLIPYCLEDKILVKSRKFRILALT